MSYYTEYDYVIVNDNIKESVIQTRAILMAELNKRTNQRRITYPKQQLQSYPHDALMS